MAAWTEAQNRKLGWYYFVVALITLIIAAVQQPIGEWGGWGWLLGAALALLGVVGLYQGLTGKGNTRSKTMSEGTQRKWAIVGLIAVSFAVVVNVIADAQNFNVADTISVGIWVALLGLFVSQLATLSKS
jgi:membrane associated rhomboid family serine protease